LEDHSSLVYPWEGDGFRFQTIDFPKPDDILSGEGSFLHGGRWNARRALHAVYASTSDATALAECKAIDRYYGVVNRSPRLLVAIAVKVNRLLDLSSPRVRRKLRLTLDDLRSEDWRKLMSSGRESFTQCLGRAAVSVGIEGMLVPSAEVRGINLVLFPRNFDVSSQAVLWERDKLERLTASLP
jgi:RES domain-containing protein